MLKKLIFILTAAFLVSQSGLRVVESQSHNYDDEDAYEIYSTILPSEWPVRVAQAKTIVISSSTKYFEVCLEPEEEWKDKLELAISNYKRLNEVPWLLQKKFNVKMPYELIGSAKIKHIFESDGWDDFDKQYPDSHGWIELSTVGFNADKTIAVVYMGHHCGNLCGGGGFHVLQKTEGKWVNLEWKGGRCSWVS